ncbi:DUF1707 domain-containing protein [Actinophytocola sp.]|uniref:DUF1707 SHOCT-like domain-containing protein n=1 Tax=Actinophytocola sp. TaxID=1872138 RepID=UPI00389A6170
MSEYQPSDIRVSDTEREDALSKLNEHMSAGRLDIDEYGERSARVVTAKTRGELLSLFGDLPEPKPTFGQPRPAAPAKRERTFAEKFVPIATPIAVLVLVAGVFVVLKLWFFMPFLIVFLIVSRGGGNRWQGGGRGGPRGMRHGRYGRY